MTALNLLPFSPPYRAASRIANRVNDADEHLDLPEAGARMGRCAGDAVAACRARLHGGQPALGYSHEDSPAAFLQSIR